LLQLLQLWHVATGGKLIFIIEPNLVLPVLMWIRAVLLSCCWLYALLFWIAFVIAAAELIRACGFLLIVFYLH
jgi:hypothetical protein